MNKSVWSLVLLLMIGATACKSKKTAQQLGGEKELETSALEMYQSMRQNDVSFAELSAQGNLTADLNGQSLGAAFNLKIEKDKQIWLSVKPMLGIEAVRVLIRQDSIFVLDRLNKEFLAQPFSWLVNLSQAPLTFEVLQDVLLNNVGFLAGNKPQIETGSELLFQQQGQQVRLIRAEARPKAASLRVQQNQQELQVEYLKWLELEKKWLPAQLKMMIKGKQSGSIELNFAKFAIENGQTYPFSIPGNYSKMD